MHGSVCYSANGKTSEMATWHVTYPDDIQRYVHGGESYHQKVKCNY